MPTHVLGPFSLETHDGLLLRGREPVALGRRAVALLQAMVERPGALLSKDALIEAGWSGQFVEESNLTVQIAALRRVLSTTPGGDGWIETMPGRGYRFRRAGRHRGAERGARKIHPASALDGRLTVRQ